MSDDVNVRIAKVLGWEGLHHLNGEKASWGAMGWYGTPPNFGSKLTTSCRIPSWSSSLDLMHELEGEITSEEWISYIANIHILVGKNRQTHEFTWTLEDTWLCIHATAAQKAEAWLKVKERAS